MKRFFTKTVQAIVIWLATNISTAILYYLASKAGMQYDPVLCSECSTTLMYAILLGFIFSSPVILFLIPTLYLLEDFESVRLRIAFSMFTVVFLSIAVISGFVMFIGLPQARSLRVIPFLTPYVFMALVSFFFIMRKTIFHYPRTRDLYREDTIIDL